MINRRQFFRQSTAIGALALGMPSALRAAHNTGKHQTSHSDGDMLRDLLHDWGEAMLALQIDAPDDLTLHGALRCPACSFIHGRCMDAMYPFFHLARATGDPRYLEAGKRVFAWAENVSQDNGSWTVIANPKSWAGITVFGAIALAETLHHHGDLLDPVTRSQWLERLRRAADYVHRKFTIDCTNINYPATAVYGLHLFGGLLNEPAYIEHARELAKGVQRYFTSPNRLLYGEGKPSNALSPRGLPAVDLGYNVEESLAALSLYAVEARDEELKALLVDSWRSHLEFMLPDGGWDNSWGTRQAKWTYWGSRTCDGCQPGLLALSEIEPAFATAAVRNTELFRACTHDGLLHGGPHYAHRGVPACVHHTFTHAKALTAVLDRSGLLQRFRKTAALPRETADGIKAFPEIAVWLASRGPWRATISAYDFVYKPGILQATGGSLAMLWHRHTGPLFAASMATYTKVEPNNMQDHPDGRADALTPRLETWHGDRWFTQLHDLEAQVIPEDTGSAISFNVVTCLRDNQHRDPDGGPIRSRLMYRLERDHVTLRAELSGRLPGNNPVQLVLPVISTSDELTQRRSDTRFDITKPAGTVVIEADTAIRVATTPRTRIFSLTPGFEALPLILDLNDKPGRPIECHISVRA